MTSSWSGRTILALIGGLLITALLLVITGCGSSSQASTTGGPGWTQLNGGNTPYNFPTVAFTCHGADGVYISSYANSGATAGGAISVVPNDPACPGSTSQ